MNINSSRLFFLAALLLGACAAPQRATIRIESFNGPAPYTSLDLNNHAENFQFAIVTDRTGGHRPGVFLDGIKKINLLQPEFVMSVGDLIEGYTKDTVELNRQWTEFNGFIDSLQVPFFYVPGNHDLTNKVMEKKWKSLFGKTYYSFVYQNVLFLCLNSEDQCRGSGKGTIGDEQYEWIKQTLAAHTDVKYTLVFMHQPLWVQDADVMRWHDVETLLSTRKHQVFAGHRHSYVQYNRNNSKYFILGTTGGGSNLRGTQVGEFDHVVWVTMTDHGPIMANLLLEGIWPEDVVTEPMHDFIDPLLSKHPVTIAPLWEGAEPFTKATTEVKVTNDSDVPMEVMINIVPSLQLAASFYHKKLTVAPNSVAQLPLTVTSTQPVVKDAEPLEVKIKVTYLPDNLPALTLDYDQKIRPAARETLGKTGSRKIDGNLEEWGTLPLRNNPTLTQANPFAHDADEDASFRFSITYDDEYLYAAAAITDDEVLVKPDAWPNDQDAFYMVLDARAEAVSAKGMNPYDGLVLIECPGPNGTANHQPYRADHLPEGVQMVTAPTATGYNVEIAIPLTYIKEIQGDQWQSVRVNAGINDFDKDFRHKSVLLWQPEWQGGDNYAGSGLFYRTQ